MRKLPFLRQLYALTLAMACISGCAKPIGPSQSKIIDSDCVEPTQKLAFPIGEYSEYTGPEEYAPPEHWKPVAALPDSYYPMSMVHLDDYLWIVAFVPLNAEPRTILRYEISTGDWKKYPSINGYERIPGFNFLVSPDGTLWGVTGYTKEFDEESKLIKYEKTTDTFEYVDDPKHFLSSAETQINNNDIAFDQSGHLWLADVEGIYEFIPVTSEIRTHVLAENEKRFGRLQVDEDGNVWFLDTVGKAVHKYDPTTGEDSASYNNIWFEDDYRFGNSDKNAGFYVNKMLLDREGRLWLDDKGWVDIDRKDINGDPLWYRVIRSPVFIVKWGPAGYMWEKPHNIFQSSDGILWFGSSRGLVRLDTNTANWCLLPALGFPIVEDNQQNLWAFYKNMLYVASINK